MWWKLASYFKCAHFEVLVQLILQVNSFDKLCTIRFNVVLYQFKVWIDSKNNHYQFWFFENGKCDGKFTSNFKCAHFEVLVQLILLINNFDNFYNNRFNVVLYHFKVWIDSKNNQYQFLIFENGKCDGKIGVVIGPIFTIL